MILRNFEHPSVIKFSEGIRNKLKIFPKVTKLLLRFSRGQYWENLKFLESYKVWLAFFFLRNLFSTLIFSQGVGSQMLQIMLALPNP